MKNKTKTYILLALVIGVWGVIGYRILETVSPSDVNPTAQNFDMSFNPKHTITVDTFSVQIANRDPFLGTLLTKKKVVKKSNKTIPKPEINWKPIIYHGIIQKEDGKTKLFIISIGGQQRILKKGQVFDETKLVKGSEKEITMQYKGKRKTFSKQ